MFKCLILEAFIDTGREDITHTVGYRFIRTDNGMRKRIPYRPIGACFNARPSVQKRHGTEPLPYRVFMYIVGAGLRARPLITIYPPSIRRVNR